MNPGTSPRSPGLLRPKPRPTLARALIAIALLALILALAAAHRQHWADGLDLLVSPPLLVIWLGLVAAHFAIQANRRDPTNKPDSANP